MQEDARSTAQHDDNSIMMPSRSCMSKSTPRSSIDEGEQQVEDEVAPVFHQPDGALIHAQRKYKSEVFLVTFAACHAPAPRALRCAALRLLCL